MSSINKRDTNGAKDLLAKAEFGYDDYAAGGDEGRVYIGTGTVNIPLATKQEIFDHEAASNPHGLSKVDLVLGNVDNTSDLAKPLSNASLVALALKFNSSDLRDNLVTNDPSRALSASQGVVLKGLIDNINTLLSSSNTSLNDLQEIVNFIEINRSTLNALDITSISGLAAALNSKLDTSDVVNDLITNDISKPLSAAQGVLLKSLIENGTVIVEW